MVTTGDPSYPLSEMMSETKGNVYSCEAVFKKWNGALHPGRAGQAAMAAEDL